MKTGCWTILCQRSQDSVEGTSNTASQVGVAGPHRVIREIFQKTFPVATQLPHIAHQSLQKAFAQQSAYLGSRQNMSENLVQKEGKGGQKETLHPFRSQIY